MSVVASAVTTLAATAAFLVPAPRGVLDPTQPGSRLRSEGPQLLWPGQHHHHQQRRRAHIVACAMGFEFPQDGAEDDDDNYAVAAAVGTSETGDADNVFVTDRPATNLTVAELQNQLRQLGQRHSGTKGELIARVQLIQRKAALGLPLHDAQVQREDNAKWYMLQTANGFERSVENTLKLTIKAQRLEEKITRVFVPILEGETSVRDSSVMPSYIFLRMQMDDNLHFLITSMQYVINFVGADRGGRSMSGQMVGNRGFVRPMPITDEAFEKIVHLTRQHPAADGAAEEVADEEPKVSVDDVVIVRDGPFKGMEGPVLEVDDAAETLTLALTVMGRDTAVTVPYAYAEPAGDEERKSAAVDPA